MVQADIIEPDQSSRQSVNVAFRVRPNENGRLTVTDIQVGGLSLPTIARVEIGALMLQSNGRQAPRANAAFEASSFRLFTIDHELPVFRVIAQWGICHP